VVALADCSYKRALASTTQAVDGVGAQIIPPGTS
jgi:hypothetical protein